MGYPCKSPGERGCHVWRVGRDALLCALRLPALSAICKSVALSRSMAVLAPVLSAAGAAYHPRLLCGSLPDHPPLSPRISSAGPLETCIAVSDLLYGFVG